MKNEDLISPSVIAIIFLMILTVWISVFLHASFEHPHLHMVEKMMFSTYLTMIGCAAISMGFGLVALVFSGVIWTVQKLLGVEHEKTDDMPIP